MRRVLLVCLFLVLAGLGLALARSSAPEGPPDATRLRSRIAAELRSELTPARLRSEVETALAADDVVAADELFAAARLAGLDVDPDLRAARETADAWPHAALRSGRACAQGFVTGVADDGSSLGCAVLSDFLVVGDVRDLTRAALGEPVPPLLLGLAGAGLGLTAVSLASGGVSAPAKATVSLVKIGLRGGHVAPDVARALLRTTGAREAVASIVRGSSPAASLRLLRLAGGPGDLAAIRRLTATFGRDATAVARVLGKRSLALAKGTTRLGLRLARGALVALAALILTAVLATLASLSLRLAGHGMRGLLRLGARAAFA